MTALVLALNPSIDAEWRVDDVLWEEKNNVQSERRWAGGKGINVARWLKQLGGRPQLLLPLGGKTGEELAGYLREERIPTRIIHLQESTRVNVIVTTNAGRQMRFNPPGPKISSGQWKAIVAAVGDWLGSVAVGKTKQAGIRARARDVESVSKSAGGKPLLILSGSLPRGVPVTAYAQLLRLAHRFGVTALLDCEGAPLQAAIPARPFLVKPNDHELAGWWGRPLALEKEIARAARSLSKQTHGWVLVSRGSKRSHLASALEEVHLSARPRRVRPRNTVGAGDALLAAVAVQVHRGSPPAEWLRAGLAIGTAATQCLPGQLPRGVQ